MTLKSNQELLKLQNYINKLQEIKEFLKNASASVSIDESPVQDITINKYWQKLA